MPPAERAAPPTESTARASSAGAADARGLELAEAALRGDRRALARLLTAVENGSATAEHALRRLYPLAGKSHLVGITGPPGAGKSTLVAALIGQLRSAGRSVAVVAVDPSSPITGGALLGDRVRMQAYAGDDWVFIRSMAARGHAGGLAPTTGAAAAVLAAAGFGVVFVETVGTGQSEVEVAAAADTTVVLEPPEAGDEVQAIKAGLLEVADLVVVNKGDKPGALRTAAQLRAMLVATSPPDGAPPDGAPRDGAPADGEPAAGAGAFRANPRPRPKRPDVLVTTATSGEGIVALLAAIDTLGARHGAASGIAGARRARADAQVYAILGERIRERLRRPDVAATAEGLLDRVARHELDPYGAADRLLELIDLELQS